MKIGIIMGSIREGRNGEVVGTWVHEIASGRDDAEYELLDIAEFDLPLLAEPTPPSAANPQYENEATRRWSQAIDACDGFVFVTGEYNHGIPGAFKNAFDLLAPEWGNKAVGFVSYGADSGTRAVEHWRGVVINNYLHSTRGQVVLNLFTDFGEQGFAPDERKAKSVGNLLDELVPLAGAIKTLRD
ncbi:NADPH-dependent FMN reductase [Mobilicoccus caccae]|uniref:FMN reductase n=1 Tax=Mobilicoccus caccae TaxID=1859295 RepID=A0ABQ6IP54_9MICO|nr:NAD(P)H-dependent oxidoreductase [Mobilicoccus caccae]GMA38504.1 FMN reductase [Mobilicoccus caccae]